VNLELFWICGQREKVRHGSKRNGIRRGLDGTGYLGSLGFWTDKPKTERTPWNRKNFVGDFFFCWIDDERLRKVSKHNKKKKKRQQLQGALNHLFFPHFFLLFLLIFGS
jgi:hypothetical protein